MTRKRPQSEEAWAELLSAWLDGELEADERRAVEAWLAQEPARARQLEELRRVGELMQGWTVEAPEPDAALVRAVQARTAPEEARGMFGLRLGAGRRKRQQAAALQSGCAAEDNTPRQPGGRTGLSGLGAALQRLLRVPGLVHAAIFLLGVLVGVGGMQARQRPVVVTAAAPAALAVPPQTAGRAAAADAIPPGQADRLWREVQAGNLKDHVLARISQGNIREAVEAWRELNEKYPDSGALRQLRERPAVRLLAQELRSMGRI